MSGQLSVLRIGFGTMVSTNSSSDEEKAKEEEAFQHLANLGGNTVLKVEYPLMYLHVSKHYFELIGRFTGKGAADIPQFGTNTDKWDGNASFGLDLYGEASTTNKDIKFFFSGNYNKVNGTSEFRENLGSKSNNFFLGQVTVGLIILNNIKLSLNVFTHRNESKLRGRNIIIGGQFLH
ncbi:MAG: hypothetical protein N4A46_05795 [Schleiferiaceae bacterium]|nr:hypothetical protein [Schleiferiaceae bacterium]